MGMATYLLLVSELSEIHVLVSFGGFVCFWFISRAYPSCVVLAFVFVF
jgi:hypothetical protein